LFHNSLKQLDVGKQGLSLWGIANYGIWTKVWPKLQKTKKTDLLQNFQILYHTQFKLHVQIQVAFVLNNFVKIR